MSFIIPRMPAEAMMIRAIYLSDAKYARFCGQRSPPAVQRVGIVLISGSISENQISDEFLLAVAIEL